MAGRIVTPSSFEFSGGMTEIEKGGATGRAPRNKLFRATNLNQPGGIMIQLRAEPLSRNADVARPIADIGWQVGSGLHEATVDIGNGSTFIVSAAEVVDVSVRMNDEFRVDTDSTTIPWTETIPYRCFGTAAPATAMSSLPARFSNTVVLPCDAGGTSGRVGVPKWAKYLWIEIGSTTEITTDFTLALQNMTINWGRSEVGVGASIFGTNHWTRNQPVIVPDWARTVSFTAPANTGTPDGGGADADRALDLTWILEV